MKRICLLVATAFIMVSCGNPMNKKFSEKNFESDLKEIKAADKLSDEEVELFAGWLIKSKLSNENLEGKTYADILNEAKQFQENQKALLKIEEEKEKAFAEKMAQAVEIKIVDKTFEKYSGIEYNNFEYLIKNKSNKTIDAIRFQFEVYNKLGDRIGDLYEVNLTDDTIAPQATYDNGVMDRFNAYSKLSNDVKDADFKGLKIVQRTIKIVYTDGSVLE